MKTVSRNYSPERVDSILTALLHHPEAHTGPVEPKRQRPQPSNPGEPSQPQPNEPERRDPDPYPKYEDEPPVRPIDSEPSETN